MRMISKLRKKVPSSSNLFVNGVNLQSNIYHKQTYFYIKHSNFKKPKMADPKNIGNLSIQKNFNCQKYSLALTPS